MDCTVFARNGGIGSPSGGATTFGERNCGVFSDDVPEKGEFYIRFNDIEPLYKLSFLLILFYNLQTYMYI